MNKIRTGLVPKSYTAYDTILLPKKITVPKPENIKPFTLGGGYMQNNINVFTFFEFQEGLSFDEDKRSNENIKDKRYTNMLRAKSFPLPQEFEFYDVSLSIPYFNIKEGDISKLMASSDLMIYVGNNPFLTLTWDMLEDCGGDYYYKGIWRGKKSCLIKNMVSLYADLRFEKPVEFNSKIFVKIGLDGILHVEARH